MSNKKNILVFVLFSFFLFLTSCKKAELTTFIPKDVLGYARIKNISKTIEKFDSSFLSNSKKSSFRTIGEILEHNNINSKEELFEKTGIDIDKDLTLFWMDENYKSPSYAYQVKNSKELEKGFLEKVKDKNNGTIIYENINIYVLRENPKNANPFMQTSTLSGKVIFFIEDYIVKCSSENDAKKIIDLYKYPEKNKDLSLKSNGKFINVINSLKDSDILIYADLDSITQKYLPMIKMMSGMFLNNPDKNKKEFKMLQSMINLSIWVIEQINSTGISIDFKKDLIVDNYLGLKSESSLQNLFNQPESKLAHNNFIQSNNLLTVLTKTNPNYMKEASGIFFDFFDSTSLGLNTKEYEDLKKLLNDNAKDIAICYDAESSVTILPLKDTSQIQLSLLYDLKNTDKKIDIDYISGLESVFTNHIEQIFEMKKIKKTELKNKKITKYNNIDIYSNDITYPKLETILNDYKEWKAIYNNKLIICYSKDSTAMLETIDILSGKKKINSLNGSNKFNDAKKLLHENPDTILIVSPKEIMELFFNFASEIYRDKGINIMKEIKYNPENNKDYKNLINKFKDTDTIKYSSKYQNHGLSYRFIIPNNFFDI